MTILWCKTFFFFILYSGHLGIWTEIKHNILTEPLLISGLVFRVLSNMFLWKTFS